MSLVPVTLSEVEQAKENIRGIAVRTPLLKLNWDGSAGVEIYLKLESLQPINSFKVRGAGNAIAQMDLDELRRAGVSTGSAGNMAQGVAKQAQLFNIPMTAVVPTQAPDAKLEPVKRMGGKVIKVPFDEWWRIIQTGECPQAPGSKFIHPVLDQRVMAGNGTVALEVLEDLPDVDAIIVPYGGGALACGIGGVVKSLREAGRAKKNCKVFACEPSTAAPLAKSFECGECSSVDYVPSFIDGCGGKAVLEPMWPLAQQVLAGSIPVAPADAANAVRILAERNKLIAEGAGACPVAAAMAGKAGKGKIVCVVSGGGLDTKKLAQILAGCPAAGGPEKAAQCPVLQQRHMLRVALGAAALAFVAGAGLAAMASARRAAV